MYKFIRYIQLFLMAVFISIYPVYSYATAFPVIQPTIQPSFPTIYPDAQSMPSGGGGTGSINNGKGIGAAAVGATAAAICLSMDCTSSIATGPSGVVVPSGWSKDSSGNLVPPSTDPGKNTTSDPGTAGKASVNSPAVEHACPLPVYQEITLARYANDGSWFMYNCHTLDWTSSAEYSVDGNVVNPPVLTCPAGYSVSGTSCALSSPQSVQKPAATPCQILTDGGSVRWDTSNPACSSRGAGPYWTDSDGNHESMTNGTFSVVSSDGKNKTNFGPAVGNIFPVIQTLLGTGSDGSLHTFTSTSSLDSNGNIIGQSYSVDGKPVTRDEYLKTLAGNPPVTTIENSPANTTSGSGSNASGTTSGTAITCESVGTCGVAQESTQTGILSTLKSIYDSITGANVNTNVNSSPDYNPHDPDITVFNGLTLPSLNLDWIMHLFPDPVCTDLQFDIPLSLDGHTNKMTIPICEQLPWLRTVFGYGWDGMTALTIANMFIRTRADGKVNPS